MFLDDEFDPKTKKPKPRNLDDLSIDDLKEYITDLETEIIRVKSEIEKKEASKTAANAFFKS